MQQQLDLLFALFSQPSAQPVPPLRQQDPRRAECAAVTTTTAADSAAVATSTKAWEVGAQPAGEQDSNQPSAVAAEEAASPAAGEGTWPVAAGASGGEKGPCRTDMENTLPVEARGVNGGGAGGGGGRVGSSARPMSQGSPGVYLLFFHLLLLSLFNIIGKGSSISISISISSSNNRIKLLNSRA